MGAESQEWQEFGRAIRRWREQRKMTQRQLAELISWAYSMVSRWESGDLRPSVEAIEAMDAALEVEGKLISLGFRAAMADSNRLRRGTVEAKASTRDEDEDMERRRLMRDAAAVAAVGAMAPVLTSLTDALAIAQQPLPGASVSQGMIDDWEHAADVHEQRARFDSPAVVLAALAVDYTDMAPHLGRSQPAAVQRDLVHAAARHASLIGGKWFDLGNRREAHRWWAQTRLLSEQSGDDLLVSWLRSREAGYRRQDPNENLDNVLLVAQEARRLAGDAPSAPLVAALGVEAMILAKVGRHAEAITTLRLTEETFERMPSSGNSRQARALWYDRTLIYTLTGDLKRAEHARDTAERLYPTGHRSATLLALHGAALHARTDPNEGTHRALQLLDALPAERRDTRVMSAGRLVVEVLPEKARALPGARELRALTIGSRSA
ncbi:helix-turn-helix transcriptional regulator [Streptosporangium sp. NPDC051023]|uniref:helix-turn-helix domain-containing protein n=1 Tax=Streptosporangium sp. NPDC051023 TaxID=3155410 RepID=UPI00344E72E1